MTVGAALAADGADCGVGAALADDGADCAVGAAAVVDGCEVVTAVGAAAGLILCLTSVRWSVAGRMAESDLATVRVMTSAVTWALPTGVAWCASPITTTAPATEAATPPRFASRSRRSAESRLRCAFVMPSVSAQTVKTT
jgi:hypothetical protein